MNSPAQAACLSIATAILSLAGCSESCAPAMTPAVQPTSIERAGPSEPSTISPSEDSSSQPVVDVDRSDEATPDEIAANQKEPEPTAEQPQRTRDISFDDVKFDIEKDDAFKRSLLTDKIEALDGKPVRIRGYILPSFQQSGLTQFVLVRDNLSCCFGPGAALYDCVIVEMKPGKSTDYSLYPVAVEGTFSVREMLDPDGKTVAIYHLDGESVR